jgi:outer membrane cobalamin receptor
VKLIFAVNQSVCVLAKLLVLVLLCVPIYAQHEDDYVNLGEDAGLTVTGTRETTQVIKIITKEELQRHNRGDLAVVLQELLGLGVTRYGPYGNQNDINMRGFDGERVAFLIDGIPANSSISGDFDMSRLDLAAIERIEVIYGGSDTIYNVSGAFGGVINIITTREAAHGITFGGSVSNTSYIPGKSQNPGGTKNNIHWEDLADAQRITFFGAYGVDIFSLKTNIFFNRAGNHFLYNDTSFEITRRAINNEIYDGGAEISFIFNLPNYIKLGTGIDTYLGNKHFPQSTSTFSTQHDFSTREYLLIEVPYAGSKSLSTEANITHTWYRMNHFQTSNFETTVQNITAVNRWNYLAHDAVTLRAGGDIRYNVLSSTAMGDHTRSEGGIYLTGEFFPHDVILIIPSLKIVFSDIGDTPITTIPKLGFAFNTGTSLTIKNNYFRSFKYPDFEDLYWPPSAEGEGNPSLKSEDGWGTDVAVLYQYDDLWSFNTTIFAQWIYDSIHWSQGQDIIWRPYNAGKAAFFGFEGVFTLNLPMHFSFITYIKPTITYQYMLSYLLSSGYTWSSNKRIPYTPEHTISLALDINWKGGGGVLSCRYETVRYHNTDNTIELAPVFLINLMLNHELNKQTSIFAEFRNITNTSYQSFYNYPMPGFTMTLGLHFRIHTGEKI